MLTISDISTRLQLSRSTVRALIESGQLRAANVGLGRNKCYRVSEEDLAAFLASRSSQKAVNKPIKKGKRIEVEEFV
jgi:excisionase family DNA binding protein